MKLAAMYALKRHFRHSQVHKLQTCGFILLLCNLVLALALELVLAIALALAI